MMRLYGGTYRAFYILRVQFAWNQRRINKLVNFSAKFLIYLLEARLYRPMVPPLVEIILLVRLM